MKKAPRFTNIMLLFASIIVSLIVLELSYRIIVFGWDSFSIRKMNSVHRLGRSGLVKASKHSEIIYELKPNLNTYFKLKPFRTNSYGLRDKEYARLKSKNTVRVAVIGDSVSMPSGVSIEEAYHSVMEERLNSEQSERRYEILNFATGGYSLRQYVAVINERARHYSPDLILVGYCPWNDHHIYDQKYFEKPYKVKSQSYPFFHSFALDTLSRRLGQVIDRFKRNATAKLELPLTDAQREYVKKMFASLHEYQEQSQVPVVIAFLSYMNDPIMSDAVRNLAQAQGLQFVDVTTRFPPGINRQFRIHANDGHPNVKANSIFADELYQYLQSNRLLDL